MQMKQRYLQFCVEHPDIPIFSRAWWLDAVCPARHTAGWEVILIEKHNNVIASFPYCKRKSKKGFMYIEMPPLTQKLGPYIVYDDIHKTNKNKKISYEHSIYQEIIEKLPKHDFFNMSFDWKYKNWLPFYWNGFNQTTRYTYILNNIKNHDEVLKNYSKGKKQPLQKAKNYLSLKFDLPKDEFYLYFLDVIDKRGENMHFQKELFFRIYDAAVLNNSGKVFYCADKENNIHAINFIVWDNECAYYLLAMRNKNFNTSGGTEFLVHETIKYVSQFVDKFDFEGSMIKGVEESYRHYGSAQTEYYTISKCANPVLRFIRAIKNAR